MKIAWRISASGALGLKVTVLLDGVTPSCVQRESKSMGTGVVLMRL